MPTREPLPPNWHTKPNVARIYDYGLGGSFNFAVDREVADKFFKADPGASRRAHVNRRLLRRMITFLVNQGIDQFLDIGSGLPTVGNVHEIAIQINPHARIVYIDNDPMAIFHSEQLLREHKVDNQVVAVCGDARHPQAILSHPQVNQILDLQRPIAILCFALFHFLSDEDTQETLRIFKESMVSGSYLAISQGTLDEAPPGINDLIKTYAQSVTPVYMRKREQVNQFFDGLTLLEPGIVYAPQWRPDGTDELMLDQPPLSLFFCGIGRKE